MGVHYRHTTPEAAASIATAIERRLRLVLEVAEQGFETCRAAQRSERSGGVDRVPRASIVGNIHFRSSEASGGFTTRGYSTAGRGERLCRAWRGRVM